MAVRKDDMAQPTTSKDWPSTNDHKSTTQGLPHLTHSPFELYNAHRSSEKQKTENDPDSSNVLDNKDILITLREDHVAALAHHLKKKRAKLKQKECDITLSQKELNQRNSKLQRVQEELVCRRKAIVEKERAFEAYRHEFAEREQAIFHKERLVTQREADLNSREHHFTEKQNRDLDELFRQLEEKEKQVTLIAKSIEDKVCITGFMQLTWTETGN
jgi:uncharacterized protein (DUF3084 family)